VIGLAESIPGKHYSSDLVTRCLSIAFLAFSFLACIVENVMSTPLGLRISAPSAFTGTRPFSRIAGAIHHKYAHVELCPVSQVSCQRRKGRCSCASLHRIDACGRVCHSVAEAKGLSRRSAVLLPRYHAAQDIDAERHYKQSPRSSVVQCRDSTTPCNERHSCSGITLLIPCRDSAISCNQKAQIAPHS